MKLKLIAATASSLMLTLCLAIPALAEMGTLRGSSGSRINVRSQPSTSATAPSYGIPGDRIEILRETRGTDGYTWYQIEFPRSGVRGWVRGDLVLPDSGNGNPAQRITFTTATVDGSVRGYETRDYILTGRTNQQLTLNLRSNTSFMQFTLLSPQGDSLYTGTNWTGSLPSSGDYTVRVGLVRTEARRDGAGGFNLMVTTR